MGKIGNFEYPELRIDEAINLVKIFKERLKGETSNFEALAGLWGHKSAKSGRFLQKLADLRKYGLITGRGEIKITPLAESIIYFKDENELYQKLKEMLLNIDLWKKLYDRLNGKMPAQDFWIILQEVTGIDRGTAQQEADKISKLYVDVVTKLRGGATTPHVDIPFVGEPSQDLIEVKIGDFLFRSKKTDDNIRLVITALNNMLEKTEIESKKKKGSV